MTPDELRASNARLREALAAKDAEIAKLLARLAYQSEVMKKLAESKYGLEGMA